MNDPVATHIHAHNERDLDGFVACFAPDCVVEDARGNVVARGRAEIRARFEPVFAASADLHCEIVYRTRVGEYVVDEEHITGRPEGEVRGVVVSHVRDGLIDHQRFIG